MKEPMPMRIPPAHVAAVPEKRRILFISTVFAAVLAIIVSVLVGQSARAEVTVGAIFDGQRPTSLVNHSDTSEVEVGTEFTPVKDVTASGVTFWKTSQSAGPYKVSLWNAA